MDELILKGASEHNLKGVDLRLPRDSLICFTGVSGSGKSSIAYDTIYREGQRRFLESLSAYARQFIGRIEKPKLEHIEGLSPTVAIDQKSVSRNPRSTVGTVTEVWDFVRLLMARLGVPHCPECGREVRAFAPEQIADSILDEGRAGEKLLVLAPVVRGRKGSYRRELEDWRKRGYVRARIDGQVLRLDEEIRLGRYHKHDIELVMDRLRVDPEKRARLLDSIEQALSVGEGLVATLLGGARGQERYRLYSSLRACPEGHGAIPEMEPRLFSFNSPQGACPACDGLGESRGFVEELLVADETRSLREGALHCLNKKGFVHYTRCHLDHIHRVLERFGGSADEPLQTMNVKARKALFHGTGDRVYDFRYAYDREKLSIRGRDRKPYRGILNILQRIWDEYRPRSLTRFQSVVDCPACRGARLRPESLAVTFRGAHIARFAGMTIGEAQAFFAESWREIEARGGRDEAIGRELFRELEDRLGFLGKVGLGYLRLDRSAATLSGGESQRIRLAAQVGSGLRGVLYILDEPSIGLHARDNQRLIATLHELRDRGNTVCVVEHDEETMRASDYLVDVGPGAGVLGGEIVAEGPPARVEQHEASLTASYLRGESAIEVPERRRPGKRFLGLYGAAQHNLKKIDVRIPLGCLVGVTGVSGSGKSSLVHHVLKKALSRELNGADETPGRHRRLTGLEHLDKVIEIDQSPIGRTPRSNPATYTKVWTEIRDLYATLPESRVRGYAKGRFSFNVKGGRCEACEGAGVRLLEMQFLEAVEVPCETCDGRRFNRETLEILYKGRSIHDVLEMSIDEALSFFAHHPRIQRILAVCAEVGLGYIKLGQPSTTLSGGEAQRVKLASELARPGKGRTLYILDEPTTGLHFDDIKKLLGAIQGLVDQGNTVLVIEHNLDVIKSVDWIFDLGPEGGDAGGYLLAEGSPEDIAKRKGSHTGQVLRRVLRRASGRRPGSKNGREVGKRRRRKQNDRALRVFGARQHNLDGVAASFPARAMTVVTGPSGSGKTSLAFDTLFREGQRRFIESLSTYARRFLGRLDRAPVDKIEGLLPAIAIDQRSAARNPRSTVGTSTEILDYLRLLFARVGRPHCPEHGEALVRNSPSMLAERMSREWNGHKGHVLAPTGLPPGLEDADLVAHVDERIREWKEEGFVRYGVLDGDALVERRLEEEYAAAELRRGLYLIVDRLRFGARSRSRLAEAFELAARWGKGLVALAQENGRPETWSMERSCTRCGFHLPLDLHPRLFSFNHYSGACPDCQGLGSKMSLSVERLIKRPELPLFGGAMMRNLGPGLGWLLHPEKSVARTAYAMAESRGFDLRKTPYAKLSRKQKQLALGGSGDEVYEIEIKKNRGSSSRRYRVREAWPGLIALLEGHHARTESDRFQRYLSRIMVEEACPSCKGSRLSAASLAVTLGGQNIGGLSARTVEGLRGFLAALELHGEERRIAREVLAELDARLGFLADMGLEYLEIDRASSTLSGGEAQRIRLAGQLGSRLTGTLYVLDEPTVGLHPRDTDRLLSNLCGLRDLGNTVVCVEHDEAVIRRADWVVDLGPGAGQGGGRVVYEGKPGQLMASDTLTARWLRGEKSLPLPSRRRGGSGKLRLENASVHNLKSVGVEFPLGALSVVTGVSGSGKSSLVMEALLPALRGETGPWKLHGKEQVSQVLVVDQDPVGTTPKSCPATCTGIFTPIRELFSRTENARRLGFAPGRFSFNNSEGRCPACEGRGEILVEMHFLADVWVRCDLCKGRRYNEQTLEVVWRGMSIADVLELECARAVELFAVHRKIAGALRVLVDVGLGYLRLGQGVHTLSGGEAQRLKLAAELCKRPRPGQIFLLDEPTTGLHADDVAKLMKVCTRLVERGATVIVIEHHMGVAKLADLIIDLGPEAGDAGGEIVAQGTPEEVAACPASRTAPFLEAALEGR